MERECVLRGHLCFTQPRRSYPLVGRSHIVEIPGKINIGKRFITFLKGLRPLIGYDVLI